MLISVRPFRQIKMPISQKTCDAIPSSPRGNPLERKQSHGETAEQREGAADGGHGSVGLGGGSGHRGPRGAGAGAGRGRGGVDEGGVGSRHGQVARGDDEGAGRGAGGRGNDEIGRAHV